MTPKYNNYCIAAQGMTPGIPAFLTPATRGSCPGTFFTPVWGWLFLSYGKQTIDYDIQTPTRPPARLPQIPKIGVQNQPGQGPAP